MISKLSLSMVVVAAVVCPARAADWITFPARYTHHPETGQRVAQYAPIGPFYREQREDFQRSGYHHTRSGLQFGGSLDQYHLVEEWGRPVRPYGEWRFPFRPYSSPYPNWGPPVPQVLGLGLGGYGGPATVYPPLAPGLVPPPPAPAPGVFGD